MSVYKVNEKQDILSFHTKAHYLIEVLSFERKHGEYSVALFDFAEFPCLPPNQPQNGSKEVTPRLSNKRNSITGVLFSSGISTSFRLAKSKTTKSGDC